MVLTNRFPGKAVFLFIILLAAGVTRILLAVFVFSSTRDTSVVGLMGMHILEGARPVFYYGQAYMGALEAYFVAGSFALFGITPTTLALVPVSFSVGWCLASFFLFRRMFGLSGGFLAAAYIALSGLYTLWFTTAAYGGYSETYMIGTLALILSLYLVEKKTSAIGLWILLGALFASGLWVNLQVAPFFLLCFLWLAVDWIYNHRLNIRRFTELALAGLIGLCGLLPGFYISDSIAGMEHMSFSIATIPGNAGVLWNIVLPKMLWWPTAIFPAGKYLVAFVVIVPIIYYILSLAFCRKRALRYIPFLFVLFFLCMYLPHQLASKPAPRYLIPSAMMLICAGYGAMVTSRWCAIRKAGYIFFAVFLLYNGFSLYLYCGEKYPKKLASLAIRERVIEKAEDAGVTNIKIIGSAKDGLAGANYSFTAKDGVQFIAAQDDRIFSHHLAWHWNNKAGYAYRNYWDKAVKQTLSAMDIEKYQIVDDAYLSLLTAVEIDKPDYTAVAIHSITGEGLAGSLAWLSDGSVMTSVVFPEKDAFSFTLKLDAERAVGGVRMFPDTASGNLPEGPYTIAISSDGDTYIPVLHCDVRIGVSYVQGNRMYLMDHYGAQDNYWPAQNARYIRVDYPHGTSEKNVNISEILLLEENKSGGKGGAVSFSEMAYIAQTIIEKDVNFVWADRYISSELAKIKERENASYSVLPAVNKRYLDTVVPRTIFLKEGQAFVISNEMVAYSLKIITGLSDCQLDYDVVDTGRYSIIIIKQVHRAGKPVFWNGHMLLSTER